MLITAIICGTLLVIYFHLMRWLWDFKELANQLAVQTEIAKHLSEEKQNEARRIRAMVDEMRTELNALNLKMGMKLK